ncbi:MAG TPA: PatB family C-S lyase [Bacillales bacterium]|nr:PatB family C-S lyase [Bacillales bacterium]
MTYNLDEVLDRAGTNSIKWNYRNDVFGSDDVLPLWVADMDFPCPPSVTEALVERAKHPIYGYPGRPEAFFQSVVKWIERRFDVEPNRDWMTPVPGVVTGLHVAIDAFTKPGDKVVIQPPVYHPFFKAIENRGRHIVENPLTEDNGHYRMDLEDLKEKIDARTRMIILCSPHNPIGRVWTKEELQELTDICIENDIFIVSDEIHSDLIYEKGTHTPFYSLSKEAAAQSLTFIAPSKTFNLAGLAASIAIAGDDKIHREFSNTMAKAGIFHINLFGMEALQAAYNNGEEWLEDVLHYLHDNAEYVHEFLQERIPQVKMAVPEATYLGWMDFRELGMYGEELNDFIVQKARLGFNAGKMFGKQGDGFQRINFACPRSILEEAMERLEQAVNEINQQKR